MVGDGVRRMVYSLTRRKGSSSYTRRSTSIPSRLGGSLRGFMSRLSESSTLAGLSAVWKLYIGMILRSVFRRGTTSPTRHFEFRTPTGSRSASSTPDVVAEFPRLDIAVAKVAVRHLIKVGLYKAPSDLLVLPDHVYDEWLDREAVRYLQEQKAIRQQSQPSERR